MNYAIVKTQNYLPAAAFVLLGSIWGSNFIYMKMASDLISPVQVVFYRVLFGFVPVLIYARSKNALKMSHMRHAHHFIVMSLLATSVYYYAFVKGTMLLESGIAGAISGAIPLFSFILSIVFLKEEKVTLLKSTGVLIGLAGVLIIGLKSGVNISSANLSGVMYISFGALCVGASFVYAKKYIVPLKFPSAALTTYQLGFGLLTLTLFTDFKNIGNVFTNFHVSMGLILGLGLLGTGLAYIIYYYIVETLGAVTASSSTYLPPVVALFIGSVIVGESITATDYAGTAMIFAGVLLLRSKRKIQ